MKDKKKWAIACYLVVSVILLAVLIVLKCNKYVIDFYIDGNNEMTVEYSEEYTLPKVTAVGYGKYFDKKKEVVKVKQVSSLDVNKLGKQEIVYRGIHRLTSGEYRITVNVVDTKAPTIELVYNDDNCTIPFEEYKEDGFKAYDNVDGDITDKVIREEKGGKVTYTVSDSSGNEAKVVRTIVYKDIEAPALKLYGNKEIVLEKESFFTEPGYEAMDDCDGNVTDKVTVTGEVDTATPGEYEVTYTVSDSSGNTATDKRKITVYKREKPENMGSRIIYLTFDDGPGQYTERLLNILDKYNVKATFFVTNQFSKYSYLIAEEHKRGHTVAVHSYSHQYSIYENVDKYFEDYEKMSKVCEELTGVKPTIVRFPGGSSNMISSPYCKGVMAQITQECNERGIKYCDWNVSSGDADGYISPGQVFSNVVNGVSNCNVSYVLQHDIHDFSVDAVENIIVWGLNNGYTFLPLTDETYMCHHRVFN